MLRKCSALQDDFQMHHIISETEEGALSIFTNEAFSILPFFSCCWGRGNGQIKMRKQ